MATKTKGAKQLTHDEELELNFLIRAFGDWLPREPKRDSPE
jgi:hypothetical protein